MMGPTTSPELSQFENEVTIHGLKESLGEDESLYGQAGMAGWTSECTTECMSAMKASSRECRAEVLAMWAPAAGT